LFVVKLNIFLPVLSEPGQMGLTDSVTIANSNGDRDGALFISVGVFITVKIAAGQTIEHKNIIILPVTNHRW
jgi:hypothetical protein